MYFKIHRGTHEIGGSCVEVWTDTARVLVDLGMPLVEKDGTEFDFRKYSKLSPEELIRQGILPDVKGLYDEDEKGPDAILLSHAHQDHYGLLGYVRKDIPVYLGEATYEILKLNDLFLNQKIQLKNTVFFQKEVSFKIGDITVTPYWNCHSAFDAYAFLLEAGGKKIFYSGDFRGHGRKNKAFKWFLHNAPRGVDYLLMEGTTLGRSTIPFQTEYDIEKDLKKIFQEPDKIDLVYTSGQNIDRLVSIYKAAVESSRILVVDVYVATVLKALSGFANIPYPSEDFSRIKVMFPYWLSDKLVKKGEEQILYQFVKYKITKKQISREKDRIVMLVRPSMQKDLKHISGIDGGNLVYSMWEGYLQKDYTKKFMDYLKSRNFTIHHVHTSGHADQDALKKMVEAIDPKYLVPIHTFEGSRYKDIFNRPVVEMKDGEVINL